MEQFHDMNGVKGTAVNYKGTGLHRLVSGVCDYSIAEISSITGPRRSALRALGVADAQRLRDLPDDTDSGGAGLQGL